jgi:hypothetical protein
VFDPAFLPSLYGSSGGEFDVRIKKTGPNMLQLLAPSREQLTLDMLVDAVESYFDELVAYQGQPTRP